MPKNNKSTNPNWKEQFDKIFPGLQDWLLFNNNHNPIKWSIPVKDFISHEIIEKIIKEVDNLPTGPFDSTPYKKEFKQQLRDKWL